MVAAGKSTRTIQTCAGELRPFFWDWFALTNGKLASRRGIRPIGVREFASDLPRVKNCTPPTLS